MFMNMFITYCEHVTLVLGELGPGREGQHAHASQCASEPGPRAPINWDNIVKRGTHVIKCY